MIVYSREYLTLEMPMSRVTSWITPVESFYVRNNLLMPKIELSNWRVTVMGEVERSLTFTFQEFTQLAAASVTNTMECAGNGRVNFRPRINAVPWGRGGVGNAVFEGPRLNNVLRLAGLTPRAKHVAFRGMDVLPREGTPQFIRSIPIEKALDPNTLLATKMNGTPLTPEHGFPVRSLVPGWIGAASIKWLQEIRVLPRESEGPYMNPGYTIGPAVDESNKSGERPATPITSLRIKSIIAQPTDGALLTSSAASAFTIRGASWAGESAVEKVEISTDEGSTWQVASLDSDHAKYAWRLWHFEWRPRHPGEYTIFSRATDAEGRAQPMEPRWNPGGYLWNGVDRVHVRVEA
jgi:DMSO/TMAO reductase YedYZ molybdopterin-dependent catalytic subunit